jgi:hypothetical protein
MPNPLGELEGVSRDGAGFAGGEPQTVPDGGRCESGRHRGPEGILGQHGGQPTGRKRKPAP